MQCLFGSVCFIHNIPQYLSGVFARSSFTYCASKPVLILKDDNEICSCLGGTNWYFGSHIAPTDKKHFNPRSVINFQ